MVVLKKFREKIQGFFAAQMLRLWFYQALKPPALATRKMSAKGKDYGLIFFNSAFSSFMPNFFVYSKKASVPNSSVILIS